MRKKTMIITASYTLTALVLLAGIAWSNYRKAQAYELQLQNTYQHAFAELVSSVGELDAALQKTLYANTPAMLGSVCTEVYGKALSAQYALSELPLSGFKLQEMSGFVTRAGDYAFVLSRKAGAGEMAGEDDHGNLVKLSEAATVLASNLNQLMADAGSGNMTAEKLDEMTDEASRLPGRLTPGFLENSLSAMEEEFPETPSLIYDGPFSSHILGMTPKMLEGKVDLTQEEALASAADFMDLNPKKIKYSGERAGNLPVYMFYANADGGTVSIEISKKGGYVVDAFNSRIVEQAVMNAKDASNLAQRYLQKKGYKSMTKSYEIVDGNTLVVNFAYKSAGVICYPDLLKVYVALDNGKIVGFEAQGYIMNHVKRDIPAVEVSEADAKSKVSPHLTVLSHELAVIPTTGKNEVFCHEFKCENGDGSHYIVYVNAVTGAEEKILILLEDENGTLTI
jgi:spore germination protein